ncbi:bidirectional sugar transporter SWEET1a-like [Punica granatum]|uniref:Bidirectional sugar transporter SWEET n=1 Tax=Punica granatum TaxID=22663 RepID=A0A218VUP4_PUNGR|nr:bidirectional sugar transporter SWEET1a-like [Punica granatum]OWM63938.1 hypothetical protein CDL15_Pgr024775 [Punica granatum]
MVTLRFVTGVFGNITALILYLSPMITVRRIIKSKSTEQFSCVPYAMSLLNCLLYTWYSLPFVSPNNLLVTTITSTGSTIEFIYVLIFLIYAPKKEKLKILGLLAFVLTVITMVALISLLALHGKPRMILCGIATTIFNIIMYASPLSVARMVIKTKSVEYMPFCLSLFMFICGASWFLFGILGADPYVYVPNGLGGLLGMMQLILYAVYRNKKVEPKKAIDDDFVVEMNPVDPEKAYPKPHQGST